MTAADAPGRPASRWQPRLGAIPTADGVRFTVWAPAASRVDVVLETGPREPAVHPMEDSGDGVYRTEVGGARPGMLYRYRLDGDRVWPDPASRSQPQGVHGPSAVVDPSAFSWSDAGWTGIPLADLVLYELHVGAFSAAGTFRGVIEHLPHLVELGVTAIELMPLGDFPGRRNWGYDNAAIFAPARCYGTPDDLRALVDAAHAAGLAVHLDVVYNHLGPDGAYLPAFCPPFFSSRHQTPWGDGINLDGPESAHVRAMLIENALHWLHEYHFDGLRLDATHALADDSPEHFLASLAETLHGSVSSRDVLAIAEDHRNLAIMLRPREQGGWGLDGVWADDFHHQVRRHVAGDREGYFRDFTGTVADIVRTLEQGWFFTGQHSLHLEGARGTDPAGIASSRFVIAIQNHDQVGNRALGERLHHQVDAATYRAATTLLVLAPETPLLFMGQEWGASTPFLYFTDHEPGLGKLVTEGRRREFRHFSAFADPETAATIPDPQAPATFDASRLQWSDLEIPAHQAVLRLYRAVLGIRRRARALRGLDRRPRIEVLDEGTLALTYGSSAGSSGLLVVVRLSGAGEVVLAGDPRATADPPERGGEAWKTLLSTEDTSFAADPMPIGIEPEASFRLRFARPGAVVLARGAWSTVAGG